MGERNRGTWPCEVCGREFALKHEDRYTVRDETTSGLMASIGSGAEPLMWDAFDCPYCGCQNCVNERKREVEGPTKTAGTTGDACGDCGLSDVCPLSKACDERDGGMA